MPRHFAPGESVLRTRCDTLTPMSVARPRFDSLLREVYPELRSMAGSLVRRERPGYALQRTELVHEAFLRLFDTMDLLSEMPREAFLAMAARKMRHILIDYSRRQNAERHGGRLVRVPLFEGDLRCQGGGDELLALNCAIERLLESDERAAAVVELKFFAGFTTEEIAAILGVSDGTVESDWAHARAWLYRELTKKRPLHSLSGL